MHVKTKITAVTLAAMVMTMAVTALFTLPDGKERYEEGIMLDFGDYTGDWIVTLSHGRDGRSVIEAACEEKGYPVIFNGDSVESVNGIASSAERTWDLWTWSPGHGWKRAGTPVSVTLSEGTYASLALTSKGQEPLIPCVDSTGRSVFGTAANIVSLSAVATEILCKTGNIDSLAAVDYYSNYPEEVVTRGLVKEWGFYLTPPTAEIAAAYDPDLVVGEEGNHDALLNILREAGIRCVSLYQADTLETVYRNIWMIGAATGRTDEASAAIREMKTDLDDLIDNDPNIPNFDGKTAVILMGNEWYIAAIGQGTFINDVLSRAGIINAYDVNGWIMDTEYIMTKVPDIVIFIADEDMSGVNIKSLINSNLPSWPNPSGDTWGGIPLYYVDGQYGDMFLRAGPRIITALEALIDAGPV